MASDLDERSLIQFNAAIITVWGIALSIILSLRAELIFTSLGFLLYFAFLLSLLIVFMMSTVSAIDNPLIDKEHKTKQSIIQHRLDVTGTAITYTLFVFFPIPWIIHKTVDQEEITEYFTDANYTLYVAAGFLILTIVMWILNSKAIPVNEPRNQERYIPIEYRFLKIFYPIFLAVLTIGLIDVPPAFSFINILYISLYLLIILTFALLPFAVTGFGRLTSKVVGSLHRLRRKTK